LNRILICRYYRLRKFEVNLDNSSLSLNGTNTNLSKTSTSILLLAILSIGICGTYYFCQKKSNNELINSVNRSSEDSDSTQETIEEVFIE